MKGSRSTKAQKPEKGVLKQVRKDREKVVKAGEIVKK
jgi:hypothetical protein